MLWRMTSTLNISLFVSFLHLTLGKVNINGIRIEEKFRRDIFLNPEGILQIPENTFIKIRVFGSGLINSSLIRFVSDFAEAGANCNDLHSSASREFQIDVDRNGGSGACHINLPPLQPNNELYFICLKENKDNSSGWVHQGTSPQNTLISYQILVPLWVKIILVFTLLILSGLFSGLILGLLSISKVELKILISTGSEMEKKYARKIQPVREKGSYLLCSLALGNVLVTVLLTLLLEDLASGLVALIGTTFGILIFGELIPQAYCSRNGLMVGAKTIWITKFFMIITFPMSLPFSFILDKMLGQEIGNVYSRDRFKEILRVTRNDLHDDEVNIISGALDLKTKTVVDVMTPISKIYMLPEDSVLDFDTIREIMEKGFSRIPIYKESRSNIVSLLNAKDLAFVHPDDKMPLKTICDFYKNPLNFIPDTTTLDVIFKEFKLGDKGPLAFVTKLSNNEKEEELIGLVTLEDVIDTFIQEEDEVEVLDKNQKRDSVDFRFPEISRQNPNELVQISQQLIFATYQYLSTSVELFNDSFISPTILQRLLKQNLFDKVKMKSDSYENPKTLLYERGKPSDYFILILEGRVQVEVGRENMMFESGPFTFFGNQSLMPSIGSNELKVSAQCESTSKKIHFIPDYTVRALTDITFIKVPRHVYMSARQASILEKESCFQTDYEFEKGKDPIPISFYSDEMLYDNLDRKQKVGLVESIMLNANEEINEGFEQDEICEFERINEKI